MWNDFEDLECLLGGERRFSRQQAGRVGQCHFHAAERLGAVRAHLKLLPLSRKNARVKFMTFDSGWLEYLQFWMLRLNDDDMLRRFQKRARWRPECTRAGQQE